MERGRLIERPTAVKVAINGFEKIGRVAFRAAVMNYGDQIEVVAINASGAKGVLGLTHLLKYDTIYGRFPAEIDIEPTGEGARGGEIGALLIKGKRYPVLAAREPASIPWNQYGVEVLLETTGAFRNSTDYQGHLQAGAGKVIIAAATGDRKIPTYVLNVNTQDYRGERIISNASCTTNCIAPIAKIMMDNFQIRNAFMTTIHAYTQEVVDSSHTDLRRARAAAINIVPTTTGAAYALGTVLPGFIGHFSGMALRVPVPCGSLADFTFYLEEEVEADQVNELLEHASRGAYQMVLAVTREPLVSSDIIGENPSALVDFSLTEVVGQNLVKIMAWYDNEWSYACRLLEMAALVANKELA
jgi:glyceraldehyde 3-phosphate dehydrogenase